MRFQERGDAAGGWAGRLGVASPPRDWLCKVGSPGHVKLRAAGRQEGIDGQWVVRAFVKIARRPENARESGRSRGLQYTRKLRKCRRRSQHSLHRMFAGHRSCPDRGDAARRPRGKPLPGLLTRLPDPKRARRPRPARAGGNVLSRGRLQPARAATRAVGNAGPGVSAAPPALLPSPLHAGVTRRGRGSSHLHPHTQKTDMAVRIHAALARKR